VDLGFRIGGIQPKIGGKEDEKKVEKKGGEPKIGGKQKRKKVVMVVVCLCVG
jgi:hypothetical protein